MSDLKAIKSIVIALIICIILLLCSISFNFYLLKDNNKYKKLIKNDISKEEKKIIKKEETKVAEKKHDKKAENIVFLGDSLTEFYNLDKYYKNEYNYVNSGVGGNQTHDILNDMKNRVYVYNPSKVFLQIGTNDIRYSVDDKKIVNNIMEIIKEIKQNRPKAEIFLESIYPINDTDNEKINNGLINRRTNEEIIKINKDLEKKCKEQKVLFINLYDELIDDEGNLKLEYTEEGLHMNDNGYDKVTEIIKKYL